MAIDVTFSAELTFTAPEKYPEAMEAAMARLAAQLAGELAREVPKDTGRLADSFTFEVLDPFSARAGTNVEYAKHVWLGKAPGEPPPWAPIAEWAERKGLPPFPIFYKIKTEGTRGDDYVGRAEATVRDIMPDVILHYLKAKGVIA